MNVRHTDKQLERMEYDDEYDGGFSAAIAATYRRRMQLIRAAADERDFYALKSLQREAQG